MTSRTIAVISAGSAVSARSPSAGHRLLRGLRDRRAHARIVGKPQHAVAARVFGVVEALQRHLQERERIAAARLGHQHLGERAALRSSLIGERRMAGRDRTRHDVLELGLGGRQEVERRAVRLSSSARNGLDRLEAAIGVAAQHGDEVGEPSLDHGAQQAREGLDALGRDLDEQAARA